jgi:hypothetical protein
MLPCARVIVWKRWGIANNSILHRLVYREKPIKNSGHWEVALDVADFLKSLTKTKARNSNMVWNANENWEVNGSWLVTEEPQLWILFSHHQPLTMGSHAYLLKQAKRDIQHQAPCESSYYYYDSRIKNEI